MKHLDWNLLINTTQHLDVELCFYIFIIILTIYDLLKHLKSMCYMNVCICASHIHIYSVSYLSSLHILFIFKDLLKE